MVLFNLTKISQKFIWREIYLMFSEQKRVKLIRSKWMTGTCYINNFLHGWYFPEFLFKLKLGSVNFSIFRLLFIEIYLKRNLFNVFGTKESKLIRSKWMTGTCYINNFIHGWYFPEFLFKLKLGSVMFSIFRLLFKCSFNGFSH